MNVKERILVAVILALSFVGITAEIYTMLIQATN